MEISSSKKERKEEKKGKERRREEREGKEERRGGKRGKRKVRRREGRSRRGGRKRCKIEAFDWTLNKCLIFWIIFMSISYMHVAMILIVTIFFGSK